MILHDIAVVGASGLVGRKIIEFLQERNFPYGKIIAIASDSSTGKELNVKGLTLKLQKLTAESFRNIEFAFFCAGGYVSGEYATIAVNEKCTVIDNSSIFRMEEHVPLVVPEVNRQEIFRHKGIIANPNCSTIQLVMILKPLDDNFKIKRVVVSTYQSVSGVGQKGIRQLQDELYEKDAKPGKTFPYQIAFNSIPQVDIFFENGYTKEEYKVINETRKILRRNDLNITSTCVRIPTVGGHCESVNIEFHKKTNPEEIRDVLSQFKGVKVVDDIIEKKYPMPIDSYEKDDVFVGRIRKDESLEKCINLWIVADNIRKGASTNAVQIAEELLKGK